MSTEKDLFDNGIHISLIRNQSDVSFYDSEQEAWTHDVGDIIQDGEILLYFANLDIDQVSYNEILSIFDKYMDTDNGYEYLRGVHHDLAVRCNRLFSDVALAETVNEIVKMRKKTYSALKIRKILLERFENSVYLAQAFAKAIQQSVSRDDYGIIAIMFDMIGRSCDGISYNIIPGRLQSGSYMFCDVFTISSVSSAFWFELGNMAREKTVIKTCANCGRFFIPRSRTDEIYCDYLHTNGKTCKQIGYERKVNSDIVLKTYRKIYKTQNARKQRNLNNIPEISNRFELWHKYAKSKLDECQEGKITIAEMEQIISRKDWMKGRIMDGDNPEAR